MDGVERWRKPRGGSACVRVSLIHVYEYPNRPPDSAWRWIRTVVLERDDWTCAACSHIVHSDGCMCIILRIIVEVWESEIPQVEIVRRTREGVRQGLSLDVIKSQLPLKSGKSPADSTKYANDLIGSGSV